VLQANRDSTPILYTAHPTLCEDGETRVSSELPLTHHISGHDRDNASRSHGYPEQSEMGLPVVEVEPSRFFQAASLEKSFDRVQIPTKRMLTASHKKTESSWYDPDRQDPAPARDEQLRVLARPATRSELDFHASLIDERRAINKHVHHMKKKESLREPTSHQVLEQNELHHEGQGVRRRTGRTEAEIEFQAYLEEERRSENGDKELNITEGRYTETAFVHNHRHAPRFHREETSGTLNNSTFQFNPFGPRQQPPSFLHRPGREGNHKFTEGPQHQRSEDVGRGRQLKRSSTIDSDATIKAFPQVHRTSACASVRSRSSASERSGCAPRMFTAEVPKGNRRHSGKSLVRSHACTDLTALLRGEKPKTRYDVMIEVPSIPTSGRGWSSKLGCVDTEPAQRVQESKQDIKKPSHGMLAETAANTVPARDSQSKVQGDERSNTAVFLGSVAPLPRSDSAIWRPLETVPTRTAAGTVHAAVPESKAPQIPQRRPAVRRRSAPYVPLAMRLPNAPLRTLPCPLSTGDESSGGVTLYDLEYESFDGGQYTIPSSCRGKLC
jgi:hypothetical protein